MKALYLQSISQWRTLYKLSIPLNKLGQGGLCLQVAHSTFVILTFWDKV